MPSRIPAFAERLQLLGLRMKGYRSRHVPTSVGTQHVLEIRGQGRLPPILLLHGFSSAGAHYAPLLDRLRPHVRRLVAPDMPGHGMSATPPGGLDAESMRVGLVELLDTVVDEPMIVFGNSMGGMAAIRMAAERPELVLGLILVSPGGAAMTQAELEDFLETFQVRTPEDARNFVDRLLAQPVWTQRLLAWGLRHKFNDPSLIELLAGLTPDDLLKPDQVASLDVPTLFLWGRSERILPPVAYDFFRRHLPGHTRIEEPEGFGHSPFLERPNELTRRVLAFVTEVASLQPQQWRKVG